jgi:hypothetical protein
MVIDVKIVSTLSSMGRFLCLFDVRNLIIATPARGSYLISAPN